MPWGAGDSCCTYLVCAGPQPAPVGWTGKVSSGRKSYVLQLEENKLRPVKQGGFKESIACGTE